MSETPRWIRLARVAFLVGAGVLGVRSIAMDWDGFTRALTEIGWLNSTMAFGLVLAGLLVSATVWRLSVESLAGPIGRSEARATFFHTQLGKYLPGGIWTFAAQVERSRSVGIAQSAMGIGAVLFLMLHMATGVIVVLITSPWSSISIGDEYPWLPYLTPLLLVLMAPQVTRFSTSVALRAMGRKPLDETWRVRDLVPPTALMAVVWLAYGIAVWIVIAPLTIGIEPLPLLGLATGTVALAWIVGVVVIFAPAGLGAREVVMVLALSPIVGEGAAASVALILRVLQTGGDFGLAAWFSRTSRRTARAAQHMREVED